MLSNESYSQSNFIDFTVDPSKHHIELRLLNRFGKPIGSFEQLKKELDSEGKVLLFAMNAGIYMQNSLPLGLYIENGKTYRKLNTKKNLFGNFYQQPNGVFILSKGNAYIVQTNSFENISKKNTIDYATQSGPILIMNSEYNPIVIKMVKTKTIRNSVCIDSKKSVVFSISQYPVSFYELSKHLRQDLGCSEALYMDGAISGIYLKNHKAKQYNRYGPLIGVTGSAL